MVLKKHSQAKYKTNRVVVEAQLVEWSHPVLEVCSSNQVTKFFQLIIVEKQKIKKKEAEKGTFKKYNTIEIQRHYSQIFRLIKSVVTVNSLNRSNPTAKHYHTFRASGLCSIGYS